MTLIFTEGSNYDIQSYTIQYVVFETSSGSGNTDKRIEKSGSFPLEDQAKPWNSRDAFGNSGVWWKMSLSITVLFAQKKC